jgi:hypothetical protein
LAWEYTVGMGIFFEYELIGFQFTESYFFPLAPGLAAGTNSTGARHVIYDTNI